MTNIYKVGPAARGAGEPAPRFPLGVQLLLKLLCVCGGVLALMGAVQLYIGVRTVIAVHDEAPMLVPGQLGKLNGAYLSAPVIMTAVLGALALICWRSAGAVRPAPPAPGAAPSPTRGRTFWKACARVLGFLFLVETVDFALQSAMGAYAVRAVTDPAIDHSLMRLGQVHELYIWLPATLTLISALCAAGLFRLGRRR